jgi:hypothetical protein
MTGKGNIDVGDVKLHGNRTLRHRNADAIARPKAWRVVGLSPSCSGLAPTFRGPSLDIYSTGIRDLSFFTLLQESIVLLRNKHEYGPT